MTKRLMCLVAVVSAMATGPLAAQEGTAKAAEGALLLEKKSYPFKQALAYETTINNEDAIAVLLSGQTIPGEKVKEAREADKESGNTDFKRPFLKLVFKKSGELTHWAAAAGGTSLGQRTATTATGELKLQDGRVTGKASQPTETEGMFPTGFDVHFDAPLLKASDTPAATVVKKPGPAANVPPTVTGIFKGNGKDAKLAYVSARWGEPFDGKPGIVLVFTEKDHSKDKKPDFNAGFGNFGSALIISLHEDGTIYGCQVVHSAHQKQGFSSIGSLETSDFAFADGKVEGELATNGPVDTFGETWEVKLNFVAPLGEIPKEFEVADSKKPEKEEKPPTSKSDDDGDDDDDDAPATQSTGTEPKAKDLALTKDASDVEYKALVEQLGFKSKSSVKSVCAELAAGLKAQGWTSDGPDMVQPQSSILKRKRGAASLTIFVKPENGGSEVKMMTEGLTWDGE